VAYSTILQAIGDQEKLLSWFHARSAGLPPAAIAAAVAAAGSGLAAVRRGGAADADTIITAKVECMEAKQMVMRQLVELDESFVPPADYKVGVGCIIHLKS
jgi:hypothetical protein